MFNIADRLFLLTLGAVACPWALLSLLLALAAFFACLWSSVPFGPLFPLGVVGSALGPLLGHSPCRRADDVVYRASFQH